MIKEIIIRQLVGQASQEELAQLQAWRQESAENELLYQRLTDEHRLAGEFCVYKQTDYQRALKQMQERIGQRRQVRIWRSIAAVAAVAVVVMGIAMTLLLMPRRETVPVTVQAPGTQIRIVPGCTSALMLTPAGDTLRLGADTVENVRLMSQAQTLDETAEERINQVIVPRGGEFKLALEDGTIVWLNADSRLYYPENFDTSERRVKVEGEAYFQVAHNEEVPFLVETDGQLVQVLGTEFNIHSYADDAQVQTTLVKGSIALSEASNPSSQLRLTPGHQALFSKSEHAMHIQAVDAEAVGGWREGRVVLTGHTLEEIMKSLSRWYDFEYTIVDKRLAQTEFVGQVTRYDNFDDVCRIIEQCGDMHIERRGRHLILKPLH